MYMQTRTSRSRRKKEETAQTVSFPKIRRTEEPEPRNAAPAPEPPSSLSGPSEMRKPGTLGQRGEGITPRPKQASHTGEVTYRSGANPTRSVAQGLYRDFFAPQEQVVRTDMAVRQAGIRQLQNAAQGLYRAYAQQHQQQARAQVEQDQARIGQMQNLFSQAAAKVLMRTKLLK